MKASTDRKDLALALRHALLVVSKKATILKSVRLEAGSDSLLVWATNLEVVIQERIPAEVSVPGVCLAPALLLAKLCKGKGRLELESACEGGCHELHVEGETLATAGPEEYPTLPTPSAAGPPAFVVAGDVLRDGLVAVSYAASTDDTRYNLNGVYLEQAGREGGLRLIATDGHRLASLDVATEGAVTLAAPVILPLLAARVVERVLDGSVAYVRVEGATLECASGQVRVVVRLIDGEFPDYRKIIPEPGAPALRVERNSLIAALEGLLPLAPERGHCVTLEPYDQGLRLRVNNPDTGSAKRRIPAAADRGWPAKVPFNGSYLLAVAEAAWGDDVTLELADALEACRIVGSDPSGPLSVVMPMRL